MQKNPLQAELQCLHFSLIEYSFFHLEIRHATEMNCVFNAVSSLRCSFSVLSSFSGLLHDYFGNYYVAFYLAGVPPIVGGIVMFFVPLVHQRTQRRQKEANDPSMDKMLKNCSNGDMLPGYTDMETHIWSPQPHKGSLCCIISILYNSIVVVCLFYI